MESKTEGAPTLCCFHLIPVPILGFSALAPPRNCGCQSHGGVKSQWGEEQQVGTMEHGREFLKGLQLCYPVDFPGNFVAQAEQFLQNSFWEVIFGAAGCKD